MDINGPTLSLSLSHTLTSFHRLLNETIFNWRVYGPKSPIPLLYPFPCPWNQTMTRHTKFEELRPKIKQKDLKKQKRKKKKEISTVRIHSNPLLFGKMLLFFLFVSYCREVRQQKY